MALPWNPVILAVLQHTISGAHGPQAWIFQVLCYYSSLAETGLHVPEAHKRTGPAGSSQGGCSPLRPTFQTSFQRLPTQGVPILWLELWYHGHTFNFPGASGRPPGDLSHLG